VWAPKNMDADLLFGDRLGPPRADSGWRNPQAGRPQWDRGERRLTGGQPANVSYSRRTRIEPGTMCAGNVRTVIASNGDLHPLRNLRMDPAETSIAPANVPENVGARSRLLGPLAIRLKSGLVQARRARGGPLCRSTAAPARSAADRTEKSQVGQTRFAQSLSARDSERSSARRGLRKARTKLPIPAAQPRRLQEAWSQPAREGSMPTIPPANPYQQFSRWPRLPECQLRREGICQAAYRTSAREPRALRATGFSLMYRTRTPFEFHRPPTRRAPSPSYAG